MKTKKKGLQKFIDFENIQTVEDIKKFKAKHPEKMDDFIYYLHQKVYEITKKEEKIEGEVDNYYNRLMDSYEVDGKDYAKKFTRRERWTNNELTISICIKNWLTKYRLLPTTAHIAKETGLSRVTVQKHLKQRRDEEFYDEQTEMLRGMTHSVLAQLYKIGIEGGNVKALNAFLNYFSPARSSQPLQNTQNNYIQINGIIVSQENVKLLPADQLKTIENILKENMVLPVQEISSQSTPQQTTLKS